MIIDIMAMIILMKMTMKLITHLHVVSSSVRCSASILRLYKLEGDTGWALRRRWKDNIKKDIKAVDCHDVDGICLSLGRVQFLVSTAISSRIP
jgi:hypothetical protein